MYFNGCNQFLNVFFAHILLVSSHTISYRYLFLNRHYQWCCCNNQLISTLLPIYTSFSYSFLSQKQEMDRTNYGSAASGAQQHYIWRAIASNPGAEDGTREWMNSFHLHFDKDLYVWNFSVLSLFWCKIIKCFYDCVIKNIKV